ncbi:MAG TPA: hypothetical protein ENH24_01935 [Nitrospirae bacterium]|nr:hypothetical protein [Nitrospirota bacterium]
MKKKKQIKGNLSVLFITAILILCAGFLIAGCGTDPVLKAKDVDKGPYAVDFDACTGDSSDECFGKAGDEDNPMVDISDREITFEAMVKKNTATPVTGAVFSQLDSTRGAVLYVKADQPKFAMRVMFGTTSSEETSTAAYKVESGVSLVRDAWTHITGVIANAAHTHTGGGASCTDTVMAEEPHLDIYVNGDFKNCATTWGDTGAGDPATGPQFADNPGSRTILFGKLKTGTDAIDDDYITATANVNAVVDELRLWTTARTAAQISECYNKELGLGGTCNRGDSNLAVYYRLNEGTGSLATDFSGNGYVATLFYTDSANQDYTWDTGWVAGNGVTGAD